MWFEVREKIVVHDADPRIHDFCKKHLILDNPDFQKKERMGLWTGSTPRKLCLYETDGENVVLPIGALKWLRRAFPGTMCRDYRAEGKPFAYGSEIAPYGYQEEAIKEAIEKGGGIIVAPCGSGKTQIGLEVVSRLGVKTLWLTHTQDLLNQSMGRAQAVFSCDGYGKITEGKVQIGEGLTFATVQTMVKLDLPKYRGVWGCVIVDECHRACGSPTRVTQFYKTLSNLNAIHKYGLTATPKRSDGLETAMFALIGGICYEVQKESVRDTTCPVVVKTIETGWYPSDAAFMGDGTINYAGLVSDLLDNANRLDLIAKTIREEIPIGEPVLILANRIACLEELKKRLVSSTYKAMVISGMGQSKKCKAERKEALNSLNKGKIDCLLATYQLAKEGLDCPNLRHVVFATPEKDPTTIQQAAGRVGRKADGKEYGTVWDFVDAFGMYQGWHKKRCGVYKKLGYGLA